MVCVFYEWKALAKAKVGDDLQSETARLLRHVYGRALSFCGQNTKKCFNLGEPALFQSFHILLIEDR